jgi:sulfur relay (sulfurtransferase) complex TusBCD TusD component (DsrE family)
VLLCPHCAQAAGITAKDLRKGAVIGTDEAVAEAFVSASKVIDY